MKGEHVVLNGAILSLNQGRTKGGFQGFLETPLDFTHQLKHSEIEAKGLQNLESVKLLP